MYQDSIAFQNKALLHSTNIEAKRCNLFQTYLKQMQEVLSITSNALTAKITAGIMFINNPIDSE
jgi:hypothetical protein